MKRRRRGCACACVRVLSKIKPTKLPVVLSFNIECIFPATQIAAEDQPKSFIIIISEPFANEVYLIHHHQARPMSTMYLREVNNICIVC